MNTEDSTLALVLSIYGNTLLQLRQAVHDVPQERMVEQFAGVINHPAWTLSHASAATGLILHLLNEPIDEQTGVHMQRHGPGSKPLPNASEYPSKAMLVKKLTELHTRAEAAVLAKHTTHFAREAPENLKQYAPTIGSLVVYLLSAHESYHVGQLMQWRRAAGLA